MRPDANPWEPRSHTQILSEVREVKKTLDVVLREIEAMKREILDKLTQLDCSSAIQRMQGDVQRINVYWDRFAGPNNAESVIALTESGLNISAEFGWDKVPARHLRLIEDWAVDVNRDLGGLLVNLDETLRGGSSSIHTSPILLCARASVVKAREGLLHPLDDRQYFDIALSFLVYYLLKQTQGFKMILEANTILANREYVRSAALKGRNVSFGMITQNVCTGAFHVTPNDPLYAARSLCLTIGARAQGKQLSCNDSKREVCTSNPPSLLSFSSLTL